MPVRHSGRATGVPAVPPGFVTTAPHSGGGRRPNQACLSGHRVVQVRVRVRVIGLGSGREDRAHGCRPLLAMRVARANWLSNPNPNPDPDPDAYPNPNTGPFWPCVWRERTGWCRRGCRAARPRSDPSSGGTSPCTWVGVGVGVGVGLGEG